MLHQTCAPRLENQEANDLAHIASGYKVSKDKLEELIEVKEKLFFPVFFPQNCPSHNWLEHKGWKTCKILKFLKFLPLTICQIMTGEKQL